MKKADPFDAIRRRYSALWRHIDEARARGEDVTELSHTIPPPLPEAPAPELAKPIGPKARRAARPVDAHARDLRAILGHASRAIRKGDHRAAHAWLKMADELRRAHRAKMVSPHTDSAWPFISAKAPSPPQDR